MSTWWFHRCLYIVKWLPEQSSSLARNNGPKPALPASQPRSPDEPTPTDPHTSHSSMLKQLLDLGKPLVPIATPLCAPHIRLGLGLTLFSLLSTLASSAFMTQLKCCLSQEITLCHPLVCPLCLITSAYFSEYLW